MSELPARVQAILKPLSLSLDQMRDIGERMNKEMDLGLGKDTHATASLKMFPTYVENLPDGTERGEFFAVDLGGSNFRILLVHLLDGDVQMENEIFAITKAEMTGPGTLLFDHIAKCLKEFKEKRNVHEKCLPVGFTFSFPCKQTSLKTGVLEKWTKGFSAEGVEGRDVVSLLREACLRVGVGIDVVALVNDTTGTLMSCAYLDHETYVGLILGTGTNACYMERVSKVGTWEGRPDGEQTIINMEWGAFGDDGILDDIKTDYDKLVDEHSINPRKQIFEKMISGMYLGEISRQIMLELIKENLLFDGNLSQEFDTMWKFETRFLTDIENDKSKNGEEVAKILSAFNLKPSQQDITIVRAVCHIVALRAARLAVAGLSAVTKRVMREDRPNITIGIDGTLYRKHPLFKKEMEDSMHQLIPDVNVKFMLSEDGSGKGAALIAAVAAAHKENH